MMTSTKRPDAAGANGEQAVARPAGKPRRLAVAAEYRPLHKYLDERYADTVVLTFTQIEDLLGFALPAAARQEPGWWADGDGDAEPSVQSRAWTQANRTAAPNLRAGNVMFERGPS